ncbi:sugar transferase [Geomonas sp. RF6]|uniref:sugar transferase n=1 Tax=Geomonas sp. RF6 TaxID=2897342 RepID=UPI001E425920|nr:sugar transferase [Geomonas sp. RF6]UFS68819.1 sugar transferase [Geomonas sp. RF6]
MLQEQYALLKKFIFGVDALLVAVSFAVAYMVRDYMVVGFLHPLPPLEQNLQLMIVVLPMWIMLLRAFGAYDSMREKGFGHIFWGVFEASLVATLACATAAYLLNMGILSRPFLLIFFGLASTTVMMEKLVIFLIMRKVWKTGVNQRVMLVVGSGPRALKFANVIESHPEWGVRILGFIDEPEMQGKAVGKGQVIGTFDDMAQILDENVVDEVVFIMPRQFFDRLDKYIGVCEKVGVKATIAVDFFDTAIAKPGIREIEGIPLLTFDSTPKDFVFLTLKRTLDIAFCTLGMIAISPIFLFIALAIKLTSKGPIFFSQVRVGLRGRPFRILKFRTMVVDAEARLAELRKQNELEGPAFKMKNDPRITAIGRFLRKTSLDELPQVLNVIAGDMSLVGPRPPLPAEVQRYERWQRRRLSMRPGMTCIHEVVARNNKDFNFWMKLDLEYIDNWCVALDLKIIARTFLTVVRGTGC